MRRAVERLLFLSAVPLLLAGLTREQTDMLKDDGGWEYLTITDANNGFETQHTCFDEKGRGECTGKLMLRKDGTFSQSVKGYGNSQDRHGTYSIDGDAVTFSDEFGYKDGPYTINLNVPASTMDLTTSQAGVTVKIHLLLGREFRKRAAAKKLH